MKDKTNYTRFGTDFSSLAGFAILWLFLAYLSKPAWLTVLASILISALLSLAKGPSLVRDYKRRGFIFAEYFWEENYIRKILKKDEKKPAARALSSAIALSMAAWLLVGPLFSESFFVESLKAGVLVLAFLFWETAVACLVLRKKIYKKKAS